MPRLENSNICHSGALRSLGWFLRVPPAFELLSQVVCLVVDTRGSGVGRVVHRAALQLVTSRILSQRPAFSLRLRLQLTPSVLMAPVILHSLGPNGEGVCVEQEWWISLTPKEFPG